EGNTLSCSAVTTPAHGTVTISGTSATYTPSAGYSGPDSFNFKANDGALDSNVATVSITVMPTSEVTVVLQQGLNGYTGARDAWIGGNNNDGNAGGDAQLECYNDPGWRVLVGFDLTSIPSNATVSAAKLELFATNAGTDVPLCLHKLTHDWVEGTSWIG